MAILHINGFGTIPVAGDAIQLNSPSSGASMWTRQLGRGPGGYALRHTNSVSSSSNSYVNSITIPFVNPTNISIGVAINHTSAGTSGSGSENLSAVFRGQFDSSKINLGINALNTYSNDSYTSGWTIQNNSVNTFGWHWWNFIFKYSDTSGYCQVYRDGLLLAQQSPDTVSIGDPFNRFVLYVGNYNGGLAAEVADLIVRNDLTLIPDSRVDTLFLESTTANGWVGSDGNSTNNHLLVNENPNHNPATYVTATAANTLDTYTLSNLLNTPPVVNAVQVTARAGKSDTGTKTMQVLANANAGTITDPGSTGTVYGLFEQDSGAAWTTASVNSMTAGIKVVS